MTTGGCHSGFRQLGGRVFTAFRTWNFEEFNLSERSGWLFFFFFSFIRRLRSKRTRTETAQLVCSCLPIRSTVSIRFLSILCFVAVVVVFFSL